MADNADRRDQGYGRDQVLEAGAQISDGGYRRDQVLEVGLDQSPDIWEWRKTGIG